jgi:hypothetical protein
MEEDIFEWMVRESDHLTFLHMENRTKHVVNLKELTTPIW